MVGIPRAKLSINNKDSSKIGYQYANACWLAYLQSSMITKQRIQTSLNLICVLSKINTVMTCFSAFFFKP